MCDAITALDSDEKLMLRGSYGAEVKTESQASTTPRVWDSDRLSTETTEGQIDAFESELEELILIQKKSMAALNTFMRHIELSKSSR